MAEVVRYDIPDRVKGDTSASILLTFELNGSALDLTGATARMQIRNGKTGGLVLELKTGNGLTIVDHSGGVLRVDEIQRLGIPAGEYEYDVELTLASGIRKTYVGGVITVLQDVTK